MANVRRRAAYYVLVISITIIVSSVVYDLGMKAFEPGPYPPEGVDISLFHSMQVVVETFTATGYGSDSPWRSPEMNVMIMILDMTGVALFFLALPAVFIPLFREALSPSPPRSVADSLADHVVVCSDTTRTEVLVDELGARDVPYVVVESDEERAMELHRESYSVVHSDPESVTGLRRANATEARALVADVSDRVDASIVLAAREIREDLTVLSVVEDPDHERYHRLAGADEVLMPRQLLGDALARKLTTGISTEPGEPFDEDADVDVLEVPITHGSTLDGTTLAKSAIRERFGVNVIGVWYHGDFEPAPPPERTLEGGAVLLVTGSESQLTTLEREMLAKTRRYRRGAAVVIGHGEVGETITHQLAAADVAHTVIDRREEPGVDVVGEATDTDVLEAADVPDAGSVVLAIPDDTTTEFVTLVVRAMNEQCQIIARADDEEAIRKTYRAGADYALSLATVSGHAIASAVLDTEEAVAVGTTVEIRRTEAPELVGTTLAEAGVRERTGCTVIALVRDGDLRTDFAPEVRIESGDELVIAGTEDDVEAFLERFG